MVWQSFHSHSFSANSSSFLGQHILTNYLTSKHTLFCGLCNQLLKLSCNYKGVFLSFFLPQCGCGDIYSVCFTCICSYSYVKDSSGSKPASLAMSKHKLSQLSGYLQIPQTFWKKDVVFAFKCEYNSNFVRKGEGRENWKVSRCRERDFLLFTNTTTFYIGEKLLRQAHAPQERSLSLVSWSGR